MLRDVQHLGMMDDKLMLMCKMCISFCECTMILMFGAVQRLRFSISGGFSGNGEMVQMKYGRQGKKTAE